MDARSSNDETALQENTDILRAQHGLIEDDRPLGDFETVADAAEHVLPGADKYILVGLHSCPVN